MPENEVLIEAMCSRIDHLEQWMDEMVPPSEMTRQLRGVREAVEAIREELIALHRTARWLSDPVAARIYRDVMEGKI